VTDLQKRLGGIFASESSDAVRGEFGRLEDARMLAQRIMRFRIAAATRAG
jgi:hypothetical protein